MGKGCCGVGSVSRRPRSAGRRVTSSNAGGQVECGRLRARADRLKGVAAGADEGVNLRSSRRRGPSDRWPVDEEG